MIPLQSLNNTAVDCFVNGSGSEMSRCVVDGAFGAGPSPTLVGLLLAGVLLTSLYIAGDGTVVVPSVVTILVGSTMVPLLPAQYVRLAYTVVVIGVTVAGFASYQRFVVRGGF